MHRFKSHFCMVTLSVSLAAFVLPAAAQPAPTQNQVPPAAPAQVAATPAALPAAPAAGQNQLLQQGELQALVAPIALYSDGLLAKVFMASTYPLDIVAAERWHTKNPNMTALIRSIPAARAP